MNKTKNAPGEGATSIITQNRRKDSNFLAKQRLKDEFLQNHRVKFPSIPEAARYVPTFSDRKANGLTKMILTWFRLKGHQAERVNVLPVVRDRRKVVYDCIGRPRQIGSIEYRPSGSQRGSADIHAVVNSIAIKVEVKTGRDVQSESQKVYEAQVVAAGGLYLLVRSFSQFLEFYDNLINSINHGS